MLKGNSVDVISAFRDDLKRFAVYFFKGMMEYDTAEFQEEMYWLLQNEQRVAIAAPRGFTKSTICAVIYPIWASLLMVRKDICIISASETLSVEFLRKIRIELEGNELIRSIFGDQISDKWTENHIILRNGVSIRARGAMGQIRGFRPDCIILDDIETDIGVTNEDQRKKLKQWLFKACLNTLLPGGQMIIGGTLIHPLSLLSDLMNMPIDGWHKRKYTAYLNGVEREGNELWPKARPHVWLQNRKSEIGSWAFASEFMNDPKTDGTAPIKDDDIRYYTDTPKQISVVVVCDPAYSEDEDSDWKVCMAVGIDEQQNRYVLEYHRSHLPSGEYQDAILNIYNKYKGICTALGCPSGGGDREFYNSLLRAAEARRMYPPFIELKNVFHTSSGVDVRNKKSRIIASLQPLFEKGKYFIRGDHFEVREELLTIGSSKHDDLVDSMSYAENILTPIFFDSNNKQEDYLYDKDPFVVGKSATNYGIEY